jgi:hypothetical protein
MTVEPLIPALGLKGRELPASLVRARSGEVAIEWADFASRTVFGLMTETLLTGGSDQSEGEMPALGRVRFCARAP